jgi:hypothetical protein
MRIRFETAVLIALWAALIGIPFAAGQGPATLESLLQDEQHVEQVPLPTEAASRCPVPADQDVDAAKELIRQAYEDDYAEAEKGSTRRLVAKLMEIATEVDDDSRRYALLLEAQRIAIESGAIDTATEAADRRSTFFHVDAAECRMEVLLAALKRDQRDDALLCQMFLGLADQTMERGQIDVAERAVIEATTTAKRLDRREKQAAADERRRTGRKPADSGTAASLLEKALTRQRELKHRAKSRTEYDESLAILRDRPDDAAANTKVGRYRCFVQGEWEEGLRALKAGDSDRLQEVADQEIALSEGGGPASGAILAVASSWWKIAEGGLLSPAEAQAVRRHAAEWYEKALPDIEDPIERTLANKRIAAATPALESEKQASEPAAAEKPVAGRRRGASLKIPCSAISPAPADLSRELIELLPTEAEIATIHNHLNVPDRDVSTARYAFFERVYKVFPVERWTTSDALYLIELSDKINVLLGRAAARLPSGSTSGSREGCKAALAAAWLLTSKSEKEFVGRARNLPADAKGRNLDWWIDESEAKKWLMGLGPEYSTTRRKLQAIEYLMKQGVATEGLRRYAEALAKVPGGSDP